MTAYLILQTITSIAIVYGAIRLYCALMDMARRHYLNHDEHENVEDRAG